MAGFESAASVLSHIARAFGCHYDDIEAWLAEFYGDHQAPHFDTAEQRLDSLRRRLGLSEAESITARCRDIRAEFDRRR